MPDDSSTTTAFSSAGGTSSPAVAPAGHGIRRAKTVQETSTPVRRRHTMGPASLDPQSPPSHEFPRRSSNFSDHSLSDTRDILNLKPQQGDNSSPLDSSSLASLSLAFALVPALAGTLFQNGSAVATDVMLLALAGVFLHWSVTQPWTWYRSAQTIRVQQEVDTEDVIIDESDSNDSMAGSHKAATQDIIPEEQIEEVDVSSEPSAVRKLAMERQEHAINELYTYEIIALLSCFLLPLASAYLLHTIRSQLSRPSEGLVSNYNLTIFLLVAELRAFSHILKLVQSRTLHLQRLVNENPYTRPGSAPKQFDRILERLNRLEARSSAEEALVQQTVRSDISRAKQEASITRDVRNTIQPELDALNRAVRRYEKKATILQSQTEARFVAVDARLGDAIALAAAAAKHSTSQRNSFVRLFELLIAIILFPINALLSVFLWPFRAILLLVTKKRERPNGQRYPRGSRSGKATGQTRYNGDRVPTRVTKR